MTERGATIFLALSFAVLLMVIAFRKSILPAVGINPTAFDEALGEHIPGMSNRPTDPMNGPAYMGSNWGYPPFMSGMLPIVSNATVKNLNSAASCGTC